MPQITATVPDEIAAELQRRADADARSVSSLVRLAVRQLLFASDGATLGRGWRLQEDWSGVWAVREVAPGKLERVRLEDGPAARLERPVASMELRE